MCLESFISRAVCLYEWHIGGRGPFPRRPTYDARVMYDTAIKRSRSTQPAERCDVSRAVPMPMRCRARIAHVPSLYVTAGRSETERDPWTNVRQETLLIHLFPKRGVRGWVGAALRRALHNRGEGDADLKSSRAGARTCRSVRAPHSNSLRRRIAAPRVAASTVACRAKPRAAAATARCHRVACDSLSLFRTLSESRS